MHSMGLPAKSFHGVRIDSPRRDPSGALSSRKRATSCGKLVSKLRQSDKISSIGSDWTCDDRHGTIILVKGLGSVGALQMDTLQSASLTWNSKVRQSVSKFTLGLLVDCIHASRRNLECRRHCRHGFLYVDVVQYYWESHKRADLG